MPRDRMMGNRAGLVRRLRGLRRRAGRVEPARLEGLEARTLLFAWTPEEVYLLELVNRARMDPVAEGQLLGLDLTEGLTSTELARLVPQEPLALNEFLTIASRAHSLDMAQRDFFDHVNPDGDNPTDRAQAAGYGGTAGENIAAGHETIDEVHWAWLDSLGHRKNVLSLHSSFSNSFHYDEFGAGVANTNIGPYFDFYTQMFGYQGSSPSLFILGVVYNDTNNNDFYSIGEGMANVRVDAALASDPGTVVATYTTDSAGNYQMAVGAGDYIVTFTNLANSQTYSRQVTASTVNVKVDAQADQIASGTPSDDHANDGQFASASVLSVDAFKGAGATGGSIGSGDTDLFRFTSSVTGRISVSLTAGGLNGQIRLYSAGGVPIGSGEAAAGFDSQFSFHVVRNQTYYVVVESADSTTGSFALFLATVSDTASNSDAPVLSGVGNSSALITLGMLDSRAHPMVIQEDGSGGWREYDLFAFAGGLDATGDVETFIDSDGLSYAVVKSEDGLVLFRQGSNGAWTFRNLTAEIAGAGLITSDLGILRTVTGQVYVTGLDASGDLVVYRQTGQDFSDGRHEWVFENLAQDHLRAQGQSMPAFVGTLTSYVTSWNGLNVAGLDASGQIHVVWWAPGLDLWQHSNLSAVTGAPALSGALTAYMTPWDGINLAGIDQQGKVSVTWWVPGFGGDWRNNNLTNETGGPILTASTVASYVTGWGGLNIAGVDASGNVQVYWWAPGQTRWEIANLTQTVINGGFPAAGPVAPNQLTGVTVLANGDINVFGTEADGDVVRFVWEIGGVWEFESVSDTMVAA